MMQKKALVCSECGYDTGSGEKMTKHLTFTGHDLTLVTTEHRIRKNKPKKEHENKFFKGRVVRSFLIFL